MAIFLFGDSTSRAASCLFQLIILRVEGRPFFVYRPTSHTDFDSDTQRRTPQSELNGDGFAFAGQILIRN
jgi:hypothetical protein